MSVYQIKKGTGVSFDLVCNLYHLPDDEWAAIDTQNRFVCSEGAKDYIYFADRLALYSAHDLPELECTDGLKIKTAKKN